MASSNAGPITGRERIRIIQGGWDVWVDRPQFASILALSTTAYPGPRPYTFPGPITGAETFSAWQDGTKITMNSADIATFLAGSGVAPVHGDPNQLTTPMGNELIMGHQSGFRVSWSIGEVAAIRSAAGGGPVMTPSLAFAGNPSVTEGNSGTSNLIFVLNLVRNGNEAAQPYTYAFTPGTALQDDFSTGDFPSGSGSFLPGESQKTIIVGIAGDNVVEINETVGITAILTNFPAVTASATGTIVTDDFPVLAPLGLSDTVFAEGAPKTVNITNAYSGSTITIVSAITGYSIDSANRTIAWDGTGTAGAKSLQLRETLTGATGSPKDTTIALTVSAAVTYISPYLLDVTQPAANSLLTAQPGWTGSGTSSIVKFNAATPQRLLSGNLANTGATRDAGSNDFYVRSMFSPAAGQRNAWVLRWTDWSNFVYVEFNPGSNGFGLLTINRTVAGSATNGTTSNNYAIYLPMKSGVDQIEMQVVGGILTVYLGGRQIRTPSIAGSFNVSTVPASPLVGYQAKSNWQYGNVEIGPIDAATRRIEVNSLSRVTQRERTGANAGKGPVTFKGTYTGPVPNRYRVYDTATGTDITGFSAQAFTASTAGGVWTAPTIYLPGALTEYCAEFWASDLPGLVARTHGFHIGEVIIGYGQSGSNEMAIANKVQTGVNYTGNPASWQYLGATTAVSFTRFSSGGGIEDYYMLGEMGADLATALNVAVLIAFVGGGGQSITKLSKGDTTGFQLYSKPGEDLTTNTSLAELYNQLGKFGTCIYVHQGASDVGTSTGPYTAYNPLLLQLMSDIRADFGLGTAGADMYQCMDIIDRFGNGSTTDATSKGSTDMVSVRRSQAGYGESGANKFVLAAGMDYPADSSGVHRTVPAYYTTMKRYTRGLKKIIGNVGTDGRGPLPTGVTRSGNTLIIQYSANGCSGLVKGSGTLPANYQIGTDNTFTTILTPTSYAVDSTAFTVTLTFAAPPPSGTSVRTFQTENNVIADMASGTYSDGTPNVSLYPIFSPTGLSAA